MLLKGDDEAAAENAARELLIHRRHVERRRYKPQKVQSTAGGFNQTQCTDYADDPQELQDLQSVVSVQSVDSYPQWLTDDPPPDEIVRRITYAANRVAHGDDYHRIARETGRSEEEVTRWAFIYAKAWDKAYPTARRTAAQAGAALAVNRLLVFVTSPDLKQAARAGRLLLVHRRHMHWGSANQPQSVGEGAGTYPSSLTQGLVAIPGDGSLTVARRSGPARAMGAVRPSASARPRDGPG